LPTSIPSTGAAWNAASRAAPPRIIDSRE